MSVISSLLNLQAATIQTPDQAIAAFEKTRDRIRAIALVHQVLYESQNPAHIDIQAYLENLCRHIAQVYGADNQIDLIMEVEKIELELNIAVPCGLMLNELITNAYKHAFPKGLRGKITVAFRSAEDRHLDMSVSDDGTEFSEVPNEGEPGSLGLTLVRLLAKQIDGHITVTGDKGMTIRIRFPAGEPRPGL